MHKITRKMYDEFLAGFNGEDEYKPKREKNLIVDTQDDKDFLDGWYSHDPEDQRPTITVRQEKQTQPTDYKSTNSTTLWNNKNSYSSEPKQNPNTGLGYKQSTASTNVTNNSKVQNALGKVSATPPAKSISTAQPKTKVF